LQARVGQDEMMIHLEDRRLLSQPGFVFAKGIHPPLNCRYILAKVQVEALHKARIDLPTPLGQNRLNGLCRAKDDAVFNPLSSANIKSGVITPFLESIIVDHHNRVTSNSITRRFVAVRHQPRLV